MMTSNVTGRQVKQTKQLTLAKTARVFLQPRSTTNTNTDTNKMQSTILRAFKPTKCANACANADKKGIKVIDQFEKAAEPVPLPVPRIQLEAARLRSPDSQCLPNENKSKTIKGKANKGKANKQLKQPISKSRKKTQKSQEVLTLLRRPVKNAASGLQSKHQTIKPSSNSKQKAQPSSKSSTSLARIVLVMKGWQKLKRAADQASSFSASSSTATTTNTTKIAPAARKLPALFGNAATVKRILTSMVPENPECPRCVVVAGPSGSGKTWLLEQVVAYWKSQRTDSAVCGNSMFEQCAKKGLPVTNHADVLVALDDAETLSPAATEVLKRLVKQSVASTHDKKKKSAKKQNHKQCTILLTVADVYASTKLAFLRQTKIETLWRNNNEQVLRLFANSLSANSLSANSPSAGPAASHSLPSSFVANAVLLSQGNMHRLKSLVQGYAQINSTSFALTPICSSVSSSSSVGPNMSLSSSPVVLPNRVAAPDSVQWSVWEEERRLRTGTLGRAPSEACMMLVEENMCQLATSDLKCAAALADRISRAACSHNTAFVQLRDLKLCRVAKYTYPRLHSRVRARNAAQARLLPSIYRYFDACSNSGTGQALANQLRDFATGALTAHDRMKQVEELMEKCKSDMTHVQQVFALQNSGVAVKTIAEACEIARMPPLVYETYCCDK